MQGSDLDGKFVEFPLEDRCRFPLKYFIDYYEEQLET
jgi:hypothetical protein